jgi:predicted negative regulator of RcsB-dependent stress response
VIRVNLLGERRAVKKKFAIGLAQKLTVACSFILVSSALLIGWRYWSTDKASKKLDADLSAAQQETSRLHSIIAQVQVFEQRKAQLQQRVSLIEQLRKDQTGPSTCWIKSAARCRRCSG